MLGSPVTSGSRYLALRSQVSSNTPPCAIIVNLASIIVEYSPNTVTRMSYMYQSDEYLNGEQLKVFLLNCPIPKLIECVLAISRDAEDYIGVFWEAVGCFLEPDLAILDDATGALEALDFLGSYLVESVDEFLKAQFERIGLDPMLRFDYFFHQWVTPTSAMLTRLDYNTAETT